MADLNQTYGKCEVALTMRDLSNGIVTRSVPAYTTRTPGLVVHRWADLAGDLGNLWVITHAPSGRSVLRGFKTRYAALKAAGELGNATNWTRKLRPNAKRFGPVGLGKKVAAVRDRFIRRGEFITGGAK